MKIGLYYRCPWEIGGVEKTLLNRGKLLTELGHEVTYIFKTTNSLNILLQWSKYGNVIQEDYLEEDFDILIYDSIYNNKPIRAKKIIQVYNGNVIEGNETIKFDYRIDEHICVSEECAKQLKQKYDIDATIIPNAIDVEQIRKMSNEEYTLSKAKYNFVVVSRIDPVKGFENLKVFCDKLEKKTKDYQIVVVGSNKTYPVYEVKYKNLLSKYNIVWEGTQNNPYKYMKNADYLIQLSKYESQCMSMYESMIIGTPVIVTDFANAIKDVTDTRGFVLRQDLSNLNIDTMLNKKFDFKYDYQDIKSKWEEVLYLPFKKDYKFSIIIPNYNNAEWLDKCLTSVANQTYKNYELIFIDDKSDDNSLEIVNNYIEKIKHINIISLDTKRLNGGARNVGIYETNSDYTLFIDSDDWLKDENVLEKLNNFIHHEDIIRTGYQLLKNGSIMHTDIPKHKNLFEIFIEPTVACWTKVVKTNLLKQCLFKEGTLCEDKTWHYRLTELCKTFADYPEVTHIWNRDNSNSTSEKKNRSILWEASCYRHLADMYEFINTTKNEQYKKYVQQQFNKQKLLLEKGVYKQI